MPEQSNDYRVVVFGAGGVGKSSLVLRFVKGTFRESYIPTIEDTYRQVISCNKNICTLQITDTTGSHQFPAMQRLSISKGHAFILVFSVCSRQSLEELRPIFEVIRELKGPDLSQIPIMLTGNKCDESAELREVSTSEGQAQAAEWGVSFMETSAKTNHNVKQLFQELLNLEKSRNVSLQVGGKTNSRVAKDKCDLIVFVQTLMFMVNQSIIQHESSYNYYYMQIGQESNSSKCYGIYGCFQLAPPWTSENRPVSLFPEDLLKIEPRYPLYTRKYSAVPNYIDLNEFDYINSAGIAAHKPIYLVSHGYMEGGGIEWIYKIVKSLLHIEDCNVIVVDWHGGSSPPYTQAVANIRLVGAMTAHLLSDIARYTGHRKLDHVHAIGHSLGAHMVGYIGYTLQKEFNLTLGRITGLDPAEPHFSKAKPPVRLDRTAAQYVDIIHTDASQFIRGGLGMTESIGHVDYYPNGGTNQPGCGKSVLQYIKDSNGSFFNGMKKYLGCNHVRSHEYFLESIIPNPKCKFLTISCSSYQDFVNGKCFDCGKRREKCIPFGYHGKRHYEKLLGHKWKHTSQIQYLMTAPTKPYCRGHYRLAVQISNHTESLEHGGEIGQLLFTMHSTSDGRGQKSESAGFISGYHKPGTLYIGVVATHEVPHLKAVEVEWKYNSSLFNPLTWRILTTPKIYIKKVTVEALEINERITICPKDEEPLVNGIPQLWISSYC